MYVTLLPVILAAGLLAALATGALPPGQGALGLVLLLCPGADRFLPLLRELLGRRAAPAGMPVVDEDDALEHAFWAFDAERKRSGDERLLWKGYMRAAFHGQLGLPPAPTPGAPVLVGATDALLAADRAMDNRPPPTPIPGSGRLTRVPLLLLLPLLGALACSYVSRHSAELYAAQHAAALRCRANGSACAAAHVCADAAIKATRALAAFSQAREAEASARAKGGPPVDLVALAEKEREALGLKELALKACEEGSAAAAPPPPPPAPSAPPAACADNLCGGAAESICSCHGAGESQRCWSTVQRCQQDAACCSARGDCKGTAAGDDTCSRQVRALEVPDAG